MHDHAYLKTSLQPQILVQTQKVNSMQGNMKIGLVIVFAAIITAAGALVAIRYLPQPISGTATVRVIEGSTQIDLTLQQLTTLNPIQGFSQFENRFNNWGGAGTYVGPLLSRIVEVVGFIDANDIIRINATDGYSTFYSYDNLYPNQSLHAIQGDLILAYSYNGTTPPNWADGPRIVFLPEDQAYSNQDAQLTTHPDWYTGSGGARWSRNVESIEILRDFYVPGSNYITVVDGLADRVLYLQDLAFMETIEGISAYQKKTGSWSGNGTYLGPRLASIIEVFDPIDENDFIRVAANDGLSVNYSYSNLYPNASVYALQGDLILAYSFNGTLAPTWTDGPRTAFIPEDQAYSNDDADQTTYSEWFAGSAGARWNKWVVTVEILRNAFPPSQRSRSVSNLTSAFQMASFRHEENLAATIFVSHTIDITPQKR